VTYNKKFWDGEAPLMDPQLAISRQEVNVGFQVATYPERLRDADDKPIFGVVLEVVAKTVDTDEETGERLRQRGFEIIDPYTLKRHRLAETWIDPSTIRHPDRHLCHRLINRLAHELIRIGDRDLLRNEQRRGEIVADMFRLAAASRIGGRT
jgi:hypothetical protein